MRKHQIQNAAYEVATQVRAVEDSIDAALAEIAELQARMMRANAVAHAGFGTIHPALQQLASAMSGLVSARGSVVECHVALADAKGKVPGLREVGFGDGSECPKTAVTDLRIVA
ncbi:MAG TPA: hypothetical protein VGE68_10010 [Sphingomicrobium sp.]